MTSHPFDGGIDDPLYLFLLSLHHGRRVCIGDADNGETYAVVDASRPGQVIAIDPAALDAAESQLLIVIGERDGDVKLTNRGRYAVHRWVNRNRRKLGLSKYEGAEALEVKGV